MFWTNANYPAAYRNQPVRLRQKAIEIANNLVMNGTDESTAIREGLQKAKKFFLTESPVNIGSRLPAWP